mgnify:CR=1 FL=1
MTDAIFDQSCRACPRLSTFLDEVNERYPDYYCKPVPPFGDTDARFLIVGLAPGMHGANRTGRMFTGDSSGDWLYDALHRFGFANQAESVSRDDGMELTDCYISAAGRCAPPGNKPTQQELDTCQPFLERELAQLDRVRVVLTLGHVAHRQYLRAAGWWKELAPRDRPTFGHGTLVEGPRGDWYCALHGYMNGYRTLGRCTLIEPIEWTDGGWFRVADQRPASGQDFVSEVAMPLSDEFDGEALGMQWQFHREFDDARYELNEDSLILKGVGDTPGLSHPVCVMAMHRAYEIETEVELSGEGSAGLMLFGSPNVYIGLAIAPDGKLRRVQEGFRRYRNTDEPEIERPRVTLRIVNEKQDVRFYYRSARGEWGILQP